MVRMQILMQYFVFSNCVLCDTKTRVETFTKYDFYSRTVEFALAVQIPVDLSLL